MNNFGLTSFIALLAIAQGVSHRHYQGLYGVFDALGVSNKLLVSRCLLKVNYETRTLASFPWHNKFSCQRGVGNWDPNC
jgi:hypothetical protein